MYSLTAMPSLCDSTDFGLSEEKKNREMANKLVKKDCVVAFQYRGFSINRVGDLHNGHLFLINLESKLIDYYVRYKTNNKKLLGRTVTQTALWRSSEAPAGLAQFAVFNYFLKTYPAIMSDALHTEYGKEFWSRLMFEALRTQHDVALANFNMQKVHQIKTAAELRLWATGADEHDNAWSWYSRKHEALRFVIFKDQK